jgi:hypothetical protein
MFSVSSPSRTGPHIIAIRIGSWTSFAGSNDGYSRADEHPKVIEGRWSGEKVVLFSFPDENAFRKFYDAPEYHAIAKDRNEGADTPVRLVKGAAKEK